MNLLPLKISCNLSVENIMPLPHNAQIARLLKGSYELKDFEHINYLLHEKDVFRFPALENGLFPAAIVEAATAYTGYSAVWVRDNIYIAYSHYISGNTGVVVKNINCLMRYFQSHRIRFENIIDSKVNPDNVMERPHVRFNGETLKEIDQSWGHAQNDALGYFLWFYCKLVNDGILELTQQDLDILALFPLYFEAVNYWQDEDSGHWEEDRKIEASSIGVVVASLKLMRQLIVNLSDNSCFCRYKSTNITHELLDELINQGFVALSHILPSECIQQGKEREYDSAMLFLIYPLQVLDAKTAEEVLLNVVNNLQGEYGVSRYLGDSFWCRDYEDIPENIRTSISVERENWFLENNRTLRAGEEAQWCIFDPILSTIFGQKFQETQKEEFLDKQTFYFNRALGQLTPDDFKMGGFKCPELYYLKNGSYVPNDATPLLWTQANLSIACKTMRQSLSLKEFGSIA